MPKDETKDGSVKEGEVKGSTEGSGKGGTGPTPKTGPSDDVRDDPQVVVEVSRMKKLFGSVTRSQINEIDFDVEGLNVMNSEQASKLLTILRGNYKVSTEKAVKALINLAMYCHSNGSSPFLKAVGPSLIPSCSLADLIGCIREADCSLRQCNAYFANIIYDWSKDKNRPPSNYRSDGFAEDTKFAAFDFFHGVGHKFAMVPESGIKYFPTDKEIHAANVSRQMKISEANASKGNAILNVGEITGGREGGKRKLLLRNEYKTEI